MPNDSSKDIFGEGQKLLIDNFRHLTTLNTFSILVMAVFLKDVFENPVSKHLMPWSFGSFIVSMLTSVCVMFILAHSYISNGEIGKFVERAGRGMTILAIVSFVVGIASLSKFFMDNF